MPEFERKIKIIVNSKTHYNSLPWWEGVRGRGKPSRVHPHLNPLPSRERNLYEINYAEDYIQPRMRKEVGEWQ